MEKNRYGRLVIAVALALGGLAACGDEGAGGTPGGAGSAGAPGAGRGGASAGRSGRGGEDAAGRANAAGEGGNAGDSAEGGAGDGGDGGSPEAGAPASGGSASGSAGRAGAAGEGGGGFEEGVVGVSGGRVSDADGDITLSIPPGALLGETRFSFAELGSLSSVPDGYVVLAGTLHQISWSGAGFAADAAITVGIRLPETLTLEHVEVAPAPLLAVVPPPGPPVSGVSACPGSASNYEVLPGEDSYEGQLIPTCSGSGGSGGGSMGGSGSVQVGLAQPEAARFPSITSQPAGVFVGAGWDVSFSVAAAGSAPLAYQWYRNGTAIAGATSAGYRLGPASVLDTGALFTVSITNRFGTLLSSSAQLDVALPSAPTWDAQRLVLQDFGAGLGAPEVGTLLWTNGFAAWNAGASIEVAGSDYGPVEALSVPARGSPLVLTFFTGGYVVYVDDDGTSACTGTTGNRLMAVGISTHQNQTPVPNSAPFVLYAAQGGCISSFTAGLVDPNPALLPDPIDHDPVIKIVPVVYALTELGSEEVKVGVGGAGVPTCGFCSDAIWEYAPSIPMTLPVQSACSGPVRLGAEGLMGRFQTHVDTQIPAETTAVLTWVAGTNVCAATLDDNLWSEGLALFDNVADEVTPVAALDNLGNALVAASRVDDPQAQAPTYRMTTSYRNVGIDSWEFRALDLSTAASSVATAFTPSGDALLLWVNHWDVSLVLATRRTRAGVWDDAMESISGGAVALGSGRPRLCVDRTGAALALFEQTRSEDSPVQIWGNQWVAGFWGSASLAQDNAYAGTDASCQRQLQFAFVRSEPFQFSPSFVAWREVDPESPSVSRLVAYGATL